ncbi:cytokine receptor-like factor 3 isoform X2 [Ornithodoros turicata]
MQDVVLAINRFNLSITHMSELEESLTTLGEWRDSLKQILGDLALLEKQLCHSSQAAEEEIKQQFANLEQELVSALKQRCATLTAEVASSRTRSLAPLQRARKQVEKELSAADTVYAEGRLLCHPSRDQDAHFSEKAQQFCSKVSDFERLPEVPSSSDVGTIVASFDASLVARISTGILHYGSICTMCPVLVTHSEQLPGALRVHWIEPEDDGVLDEKEYYLQHALGNVFEGKVEDWKFHDAYHGLETSAVVRALPLGHEQSFRVAKRSVGAKTYSPWSPIFVALTTIPHYRWDTRNHSYQLTDEGRIATRMSADASSPFLFSRELLFRTNHSLVFKFLETPEIWDDDEGLALVVACKLDNFLQPGAIFVNMEG